MRRLTTSIAFIVIVGLLVGSQAQGQQASSAAQARALKQQLDALKPPLLDSTRQQDQKYVESYVRQLDQYQQKRDALIKQYVTSFPDQPDAMKLGSERWMRMAQRGQRQEVIDETTPILAKTTDPKDRADILFVRAAARVMMGKSTEAAPAVDEFVKAAPQDDRGGELLVELGRTEHNSQKQAEIYRQVADRYAATMYGQMAKGLLRQSEGVGKPFDLTFKEAITGKGISVQKDLKGKVVVIDFWATWCGPCVAEMPENKKIYAEYKDKGVEFIGVSLDQPEDKGGLKALKEFVAKNDIKWPQYYQGNYWESEFSKSWGINSIPAVFIVDKEGKLHSVDARGQLEKLIPELLAKTAGTASAHTGDL